MARIVAVHPADAKCEHPYIATFLLADRFWRPFALIKGPAHKNYEKGPSGLQKHSESIARTSTLRHRVLQLLGLNNLFVGFNIAWVLTALKLPLPASRVVELGAETSLQHFCQQPAQINQTFSPQLFVPQRISYDRRWAAVCQKFDVSTIDLYLPEATSSQKTYKLLRFGRRRTRR